MVTYASSLVIVEVTPNPELKTLIIETPTLTTSGDICTFNLIDYGISASGLLSVVGVMHSGAYSMIAAHSTPEQVYTTTSSSGVIQITVMPKVSSGLGKRVYTLIGKSN